ncbi:hypothetical protein IWW51_005456, partial [Coemansia sp. RSA 2702]
APRNLGLGAVARRFRVGRFAGGIGDGARPGPGVRCVGPLPCAGRRGQSSVSRLRL